MPNVRGIRAAAAYVELVAHDGKLAAGLRPASRRLRAWGKSTGLAGRQLLKLSAAAAAPFALATRRFASFSDQMLTVKAVTQADGKAFDSLTSKAKELGRETSFTAVQVAEGMTNLGRQGFKAAEIIRTIPDVLNLARGTTTDLGEAARIAATNLRSFKLEAADMTRVADVLTSVANESAQELTDVADAMKLVVPLAVEAGASIEDVGAMLMLMANNGLRGSIAGTSLARAYKNLVQASPQKLLRSIGVEALDQAGNIRGLADIMRDLALATADMPSGRKLRIFEELFGRGTKAALKLADPQANLADMQRALLNVQGTADRTAKIMDSGLGGALRRLWSAVEGIAIAVGEALDDTLQGWAERATAAARAIAELVEKNKELIRSAVKIIAIAAGIATGLIVLGGLLTAAGLAAAGLAALIGMVGTALATAMGVVAAILSPIGLLITAIVALGATLIHVSGAGSRALEWLREKFGQLADFARESIGAISAALMAGDIEAAARVVWTSLKIIWLTGKHKLIEIWENLRMDVLGTFADLGRKLKMAWEIVVAGLSMAWVKLIGVLRKAWATFVGGFRKTLEHMQNWAARRWVDIQAVFDPEMDKAAVLKNLEGMHKKRMADIKSEQQAKVDQLKAEAKIREQSIKDMHKKEAKQIEAEFQQRMANLNARRAAAVGAAREELDAAREAWRLAVDRARAAGREEPADPAAQAGKVVSTGIQKGAAQLQRLIAGPGGGFSAFEAALSAQAGPAAKSAEHLREIKKELKDANKQLKRMNQWR